MKIQKKSKPSLKDKPQKANVGKATVGAKRKRQPKKPIEEIEKQSEGTLDSEKIVEIGSNDKEASEDEDIDQRTSMFENEKEDVSSQDSDEGDTKNETEKDDDDDDDSEDEETEALVASLENNGSSSSSSDDANSDEEDMARIEAETRDDFKSMKETISLNPRTDKKLKERLEKADQNFINQTPGVVFFGRIPHGFYENEMREYFSQFGTVTRLRLSRNRKTGQSKHYAFIEFRSPQVAAIVAETMNNYLLFGHILKCCLIPMEKVHPNLFIGANKKFKAIPWKKVVRIRHNAKRTPEERKEINEKLIKKDEKRKQRLNELGIDYDYPGYRVKKIKTVKKNVDNSSKSQKTSSPGLGKKNKTKKKIIK